jgi:sugar (pentulose or hexulose) kinase
MNRLAAEGEYRVGTSGKRRRTYLVVDIGSSSVKAAVGHATGRPAAVASRPIAYTVPAGGPDTALDVDLEAVWRSTIRAVREALGAAKARPADIAAVGVTSQRLGLALLDSTHNVLYAGPNRDARAVFEGGEIDAGPGPEIWQATGHGPGLLLAWSKLLWFKRNRPDVYDRVRYVAGLADWLAHRLTGVLSLEAALATDSGLALVTTGLPAGVFRQPLGLEGVTLPPVCRAGDVLGTLKSPAAASLGIPAGIPVIPCGPDTQVGLAGMGVGANGEAGVVAGWSAASQLVTGAPVSDGARSLWTGRHVVPGRYVLEANAGDMGGAYAWLLGMLLPQLAPGKAYTLADRMAGGVEPGARGASAYLGPTFVNMLDVGLRTGGILFPVPLAFQPPDRASLVRSALENFAFALRYSLDRLTLSSGLAPASVAVGGGMARSRTFREITAAVAGAPVGFDAAGDATLRGALSITAVGAGETGWDRVLNARRRELHAVGTAPEVASQYGDLYDAWRLRERTLAGTGL